MRLHIILEPDSAGRFLELGQLAERLGFAAVWTANHAAARDPFMAFSELARNSEKIRIGPVAISPFELHPLKIANQLFTLNEFSSGRANIVVGGGGGTLIAMRLKSGRYVTHQNMVQGVRECVDFLKQVSADAPLTYQGDVFQIDHYWPRWARDARPTIYVGATKPKMLRMGAEVADGVMFSDLTESRLPETMTILKSALAEFKRDPQQFRINNLFCWHVKKDRKEAIAEARRKLWVRGMLEHWYISPVLDEAECRLVSNNMNAFIEAYVNDSPEITGVPDAIVDKLVEELTFAGDYSDIDRLADRFAVFERAGINEMSIRLYDDPEASIRLLAKTFRPGH